MSIERRQHGAHQPFLVEPGAQQEEWIAIYREWFRLEDQRRRIVAEQEALVAELRRRQESAAQP